MSLNQWLGKKKPSEHKETFVETAEKPQACEQKQEPPRALDEAEKAAILKPKIRKILGKKESPAQEPDATKEGETSEEATPAESLEQEYLAELERLKAWITPRTYLKADLDTAGTIISGIATIYHKLKGSEEQERGDLQAKIRATSTKELYQKVPIDFLPDPARRALIRLIQGKPEQKDSYQIRKIQKDAEAALKTTQIYHIILELIDRAKMAKKKVNQTSPDA